MRQRLQAVIALLLIVANGHCVLADDNASQIRAGMIGLDTSHVPAFANAINNPDARGDLRSIKVVAGYPGGTDFPASANRVKGFTQNLRDMGIEIVETIPELLEKVDVVLLESVDGRIHWEEAQQVILAGKPLFIDKPLAGSLADAVAILELAKKHDVPCFSSSSLRYSDSIQAVVHDEQIGDVLGCATWGPCSIQETIPDLFFYGVHGVEGLFTIMGPGCQSVTRAHTDDLDLVTGVWSDGRIGTYRGIRDAESGFGAMVFGRDKIVQVGRSGGYAPMLDRVATFFKTGKSPVAADETLEVFAFMEAADESKRQGGRPVSIESVLAKAKAEAQRKIAEISP